ncbi:MAG: uncharacterized protein K0R16_1873 [Nitrososphaeraceae archaeon]|nr:uncharacterized protein [Nitrososphaeraceae archaeon]
MRNSTLYFHKYIFAVLFIEFVFITQPSSPPTNTSIIINNNSGEQNKSKMIKAVGHFANNQIQDGIVTWIQGGFWELKINDTDNSNVNNNKSQLINNNSISKANFIANFTMIKPDGTFS